MPPRSWPATQIAAASTAATARTARAADGGRYTPTAIKPRGGQPDRGGQSLVSQERRAMLADRGQPGRFTPGHAGEHDVHRLRGPVRGQQREIGQAGPQDEPERPRGRGAHGAGRDEGDARTGGGGRCPAPVGRPQQDRQQRVQDHRARGAADRAGRPGQHPAQPFTEPPHAGRPDDQRSQREPDRRPPGNAETQQELDGGEGRVQQPPDAALRDGRPRGISRLTKAGLPCAAAASIWLKARVNVSG